MSVGRCGARWEKGGPCYPFSQAGVRNTYLEEGMLVDIEDGALGNFYVGLDIKSDAFDAAGARGLNPRLLRGWGGGGGGGGRLG